MMRLRNRDSVKMTWDGVTDRKRNGHLHWCDKVLENIIPNGIPMDKDHKIERTRFKTITTKGKTFDENVINVYTDGSTKTETSGCGWVIIIGNRVIHAESEYLGFNITTLQAEVNAINSACLWLDGAEETENIKKVVIYSVCKEAPLALSKRETVSKTVHECQVNVNKLSKSHHITLQWVKSHSDILGNDLADKLAKASTKDRIPGPGPFLALTIPAAKKLVHNFYSKLWKKEFDNCEIKHTKSLITEINMGKEYHKQIVKYSRIQLRLLCYRSQ